MSCVRVKTMNITGDNYQYCDDSSSICYDDDDDDEINDSHE